MNNNPKATALQSSIPPITLTTFTRFLLTKESQRERFVRDCYNPINFATHWHGMRCGIKRAHREKIPDLGELVTETLKQKGTRLDDYRLAAQNYSVAVDNYNIAGERLKSLKSTGFEPVVNCGGLPIKINPEIVLQGDRLVVQKLYFGKNQPMSDLAARQICSLMSYGITTDNPLATEFLITDVYRGSVFVELECNRQALESAVMNAKSFVNYLQKLRRSDAA